MESSWESPDPALCEQDFCAQGFQMASISPRTLVHGPWSLLSPTPLPASQAHVASDFIYHTSSSSVHSLPSSSF